MRIFYRNNGTISVFLSLILLPVILLGCLTVDASRVYLSKVVISDAGEMAMNAGLAQYNEILHDEYGLLVMDKSPEAMSNELEDYFNTSLNGTGLPDAEDYDKILDLLTKKFEAINVAGSEIYRTDVEKQQIIEYMKYRAPVCLTELVLEKIGELKNTKTIAEAMEAEMDFSESMEDCQKAFEKALESLDILNQAVESFPSEDSIRREMENTEKDYKETVSRCLLMRELIQRYDEKSRSTDLKALAEGFIDAAKKVNLSSPESRTTFNTYIDCLYYMNSVTDLGGVRKLLEEYDKAKEEEEANTEEGSETENIVDATEADREELEKIVKDYQGWQNKIEGYANILLSRANEKISSHHNTLNSYRETAKTAKNAAKTSYDRLEDVKKKLQKAREDFGAWDGKNNELKESGASANMDIQVEEYRKFFSSGNGNSDLKDLEVLMASVSSDEGFFGDILKVLDEEKFFGKSIASDSADSQMNKYMSEADSAVRKSESDYTAIENVRKNFIRNYEHIEISSSHSKVSINGDPFYQKLREYCNEQNGHGSQSDQDAANSDLNQSGSASTSAESMEGYPTFNWGNPGVTLPSSKAESNSRTADGALTDLNGNSNISDSSARRDSISKFRESIGAASSFLDGVDRIVADGLENLYLAEYAMQMFSYYTVDKEEGQTRPDQDIISISGYSLKEHKAYRAECEYILWGDQSSQANIRNTFMLLFGIRLLFNSFYAFTDAGINGTATAAATAIANVAAPYLIPIIKVAIKLGYAGVETANDISKLKQGYGVTILKNSSTWATGGGDNTKGVTFDYSEYLRVFLNVSLLAGHEVDILGRTADCIQVNEPDINLLNSYTMLAVEAEVTTRTTFMRKVSELGEGGALGFPEDTYPITYQSILGY